MEKYFHSNLSLVHFLQCFEKSNDLEGGYEINGIGVKFGFLIFFFFCLY